MPAPLSVQAENAYKSKKRHPLHEAISRHNHSTP
ncbi:Hypothetical protein PYTT_0904 [Akkermansia glycaniphila]|uniref:Uncharacterized protein n=1 Tax=Akkermansia glycaniphila TaxID=1679444 RepID=A0A1H6KYB2_9BACT|nr:Hypothetical protein PYTT_0904 [Akkermansia glycaniphila]